MKKWPHKVDKLSKPEIMSQIKNEKWQEFRKSLKGQSTETKLSRLHAFLAENPSMKVVVDNYLNALRRGGQLDSSYEVVR